MKKFLLSGAAIAAMLAGGAASAADLPAYKAPPPVAAYYNWSGFYVGGFTGGAWGRTDTNSLALGTLGNVDLRGAGVLAGGTVGLNYQVGYWVFGIEADSAWTNFNGNRTCPSAAFPIFTTLLTCHTHMTSMSTVAGRVGYAWDNVLLFAKGGGAWKRGSEDITNNSNGQVFDTVTDNRSGWVIGGGLEFGFTPNWSAKVEYDYLDFGSKRLTGALPAFLDWNVKEQVHAVKFGVNYRFAYGPVYANY